MTIRYIYKFSNNERGHGERTYPKARKAGWLWISVENPSLAELERLSADFDIPKKHLERFAMEKRSMRYSFSPLSFVMVDYYVSEGKIKVDNILFFVKENLLVTVSVQEKIYTETFESVKQRLKDYPLSIGYLLYDVLDFDAEENFEVLAITEKRITQLEEKVLVPEKAKEKIAEIAGFKRELLLMWRRFWGSAKVLFSIKKGLTPIHLDTKLFSLFDDVHDTYAYQMEIASSQREVLTDSLTIYQAVLANRLAGLSNILNLGVKRLTWIMFLLTGIGTVLTVPNTIATVFGTPLSQISTLGFILWLIVISTAIPVALFLWYWHAVKNELATHESTIELPGLPKIESKKFETQKSEAATEVSK